MRGLDSIGRMEDSPRVEGDVMGLLTGLMGSPTYLLERRLEKMYVSVYQLIYGMSLGEAREEFARELTWSKEEWARGGDFTAIEWYGSYLVSHRHTDVKIGVFLARIRAEGVRDKDVKWFWDMHNLERILMMRTFTMSVGAFIMSERVQGKSLVEAHVSAKRIHPLYGNPEDLSHAQGEDRPIPVELKDRVDLFVEKRLRGNQEHFRAEMMGSSSFNALIRKEIRAGKI
jgi:hypothetical protein